MDPTRPAAPAAPHLQVELGEAKEDCDYVEEQTKGQRARCQLMDGITKEGC